MCMPGFVFVLVGSIYCFSSVILAFPDHTHRGSYMRAHVLLNLLNKLGRSDKMLGLLSILSLSQQV